jgi:hypothetical protein
MSISTRRSMDEIAVDAPPEQETKAPGKAISKLLSDYPNVELATLVDAPPEGEQWLHEILCGGPHKISQSHCGPSGSLATDKHSIGSINEAFLAGSEPSLLIALRCICVSTAS